MTRRTAAALLITRGSDSAIEVYLGERSPKLRFFGGYWALLGGTIDEQDFGDERDEAAAMQACARRELFEESGLLWQRVTDSEQTREHLMAVRAAMLAKQSSRGDGRSLPSWHDTKAALQGAPLRELCRIETPPFAPVRYDTVFFHVPVEDCSAGTNTAGPEIWAGELTDGRFFRPDEALAAWRRGEMLLVPPLVIVLEHLERAADFDDFARAMAATAGGYRNGRLHRVRFSPGVVLAPLRTPTLPPATTTNCYIVGHDRLYVIDPGSPDRDEQLRLLALLDELEQDGASIEGILLTHHHPDHVGGVTALSNERHLRVHGHPLTLSRLTPGFLVGREIEHGTVLPLGAAPDGTGDWQLKALHTPGHDRGHLCFRESRYGAVIVGDMLSTVSTIIVDPPEGHLATYLQSLELLERDPISTLYPAHGPAMRDGQRLVRQYLRHRRQRESSLLKALLDGGGTIEELLPKVYWDADPKLYRFAARSLLAGLQKLADEGLAVADGERWSASGS